MAKEEYKKKYVIYTLDDDMNPVVRSSSHTGRLNILALTDEAIEEFEEHKRNRQITTEEEFWEIIRES